MITKESEPDGVQRTREKRELPPEVVQEQFAAVTVDKIKQIVDQLNLNGGMMPVNLLGARFHLKKVAFDQSHLPWILSGASVVMKDTQTVSQSAGGIGGKAAIGNVPDFLQFSIAGKVTISETCGKHPNTILSELWQKQVISKPKVSGNSDTGYWNEVEVFAGAKQGKCVGHGKARERKMAVALASENLLEKIAESGVDIKSAITKEASGGVDGPGGVETLGVPKDSVEVATRSGGGGAPPQGQRADTQDWCQDGWSCGWRSCGWGSESQWRGNG